MRQNAYTFCMFWFCFVLSTASGLLQLSEYITWRFKENVEEENEDICMAAAGFIFLASNIKTRRFRVRPTLSKRKILTNTSVPYSTFEDLHPWSHHTAEAPRCSDTSPHCSDTSPHCSDISPHCSDTSPHCSDTSPHCSDTRLQ